MRPVTLFALALLVACGGETTTTATAVPDAHADAPEGSLSVVMDSDPAAPVAPVVWDRSGEFILRRPDVRTSAPHRRRIRASASRLEMLCCT